MSDNLEKDLTKAQEKEQREKKKQGMKAAAAKRTRRSPAKYFKDARAEFKKVVWPTPKQVLNNTGVVLTAIIVMGAAIFGVDNLLAWILRLVYNVELR